jgi:hypothetical protein
VWGVGLFAGRQRLVRGPDIRNRLYALKRARERLDPR